MLTDIYFSYAREAAAAKPVKTLGWRVAGALDTALVVWLVAGSGSAGAIVGAIELAVKLAFYLLQKPAENKPQTAPPSPTTASVAGQLFRQYYAVSRSEREQLNRHPAFTIWLTGLSGSGKSTLASELDRWLHGQQVRSYIIDGDNTRLGINKDLDFSRQGRQENIRRVAEMCRLFNEAGVVVISSFISPFEQDRRAAARIIGEENFVEVFVDASLDTCAARDKKGLYKLAKEGKIADFTGISSPYEAPAQPQLHIYTDDQPVADSIAIITQWIQKNKLAIDYAPLAGTKTSLFQ